MRFVTLFLVLFSLSLLSYISADPCETSSNGRCLNTRTSSCTGGQWRHGLCPSSGASVLCCVPNPTPRTPCTQRGGECTSTCDETTHTFSSGLCPGTPASVKCCAPKEGTPSNPPTTENPPTTPTPTPTPTPSTGVCFNAGGVKLVTTWEGWSATFYDDGVGVRTIGYGSACNTVDCSKIKAPITKEEGVRLMVQELQAKSACVSNAVGSVPLNSNQFSALVSFAYNVGCGGFQSSSVLRNVKRRQYTAAANSMMLWNRAGGRVMPGLTNRRRAEQALFLSQATTSCYFTMATRPVVGADGEHWEGTGFHIAGNTRVAVEPAEGGIVAQDPVEAVAHSVDFPVEEEGNALPPHFNEDWENEHEQTHDEEEQQEEAAPTEESSVSPLLKRFHRGGDVFVKVEVMDA